MPEAAEVPLKVDALAAGYGRKEVLRGVSLTVEPGEIVAVIGHNGAGKSTLLKAVFGLLPIWSGRITFDGQPVAAPNPRRLLRDGMAYVPQGNRVFTDLTVRENLEVAGTVLEDRKQVKARIEESLTQFPALAGRLRQRAGTLSGGEKQMLALASGLLTGPRMLLLDEPSLGLSPQLAKAALDQVRHISETRGVSVLIVEQKVREVLKISRRVYVLRNGVVSYSGGVGDLADADRLREVYL